MEKGRDGEWRKWRKEILEKGRDKQGKVIEKRRYKERKKWIGKDGERKR